MMTRSLSFLQSAVAVTMLIATGCGGAAPPPITQASFCADKAKRECSKLAARCNFEQSACETDRNAVCMALATSQLSATRKFKPQNTAACLGKVDQVLANPQITAAQWEDMVDTCNRVWEGDGVSQSPCTNKYDCTKGFICDKGFCAKEKKVGAAAFCTNPGEVCSAAGEYCSYNGSATPPVWGCQARAGLDQPCGPDSSGINNVQCLDAYYCSNGRCASKLALGTPCNANRDCMSGLCEPFQFVCASQIGFSLGSPSCARFRNPTSNMTPMMDAGTTPPMDAASVERDAGTD